MTRFRPTRHWCPESTVPLPSWWNWVQLGIDTTITCRKRRQHRRYEVGRCVPAPKASKDRQRSAATTVGCVTSTGHTTSKHEHDSPHGEAQHQTDQTGRADIPVYVTVYTMSCSDPLKPSFSLSLSIHFLLPLPLSLSPSLTLSLTPAPPPSLPFNSSGTPAYRSPPNMRAYLPGGVT